MDMFNTCNDPIAVFDSGMGGISVLRQLHELMPNEHYIYMGDSAHAPYGSRTREEVLELSMHWMDYFLELNAKAVVIACNTATSAAAATLRELHPEIPIIGLEPALKPAAIAYENTGKHVLVMATELTLREEKFQNLLSQYEGKAHIHLLPAPGIVKLVEANEIDTEPMQTYLKELLSPYIEYPISAVVLGCTHFPFAKKTITDVLGKQVEFFDGAHGAAMQLKRMLDKQGLRAAESQIGTVDIRNSSDSTEKLELSKRLFHI